MGLPAQGICVPLKSNPILAERDSCPRLAYPLSKERSCSERCLLCSDTSFFQCLSQWEKLFPRERSISAEETHSVSCQHILYMTSSFLQRHVLLLNTHVFSSQVWLLSVLGLQGHREVVNCCYPSAASRRDRAKRGADGSGTDSFSRRLASSHTAPSVFTVPSLCTKGRPATLTKRSSLRTPPQRMTHLIFLLPFPGLSLVHL